MLTEEEQKARRERYLALEPSPSGDNNWRVARLDGDVYVEIFALGGPEPGPTRARVVTYGPRGGVRFIVSGNQGELEGIRRAIDLADDAIHRFDWGRP